MTKRHGSTPGARPCGLRHAVSTFKTPETRLAGLAHVGGFAEDRAVIRKAFRMSVDPGEEGEYERRHSPVWPELEAVLVEHGVRTYSIFLDPETNDLFGYVEITGEEQWKAIGATEVCRRWWRHMRDLMPTNADASPVSRDLREVFHLDAAAPHEVGVMVNRSTHAKP
jgi:L-rhamnose mutarotase